MGCGVSKLAPDQEGRLRPVLRRRLEELVARRNAGLSKKQLLEGDAIIVSRDSEVDDEDNIIINNNNNNNQHDLDSINNNKNKTLDNGDHHNIFHDTLDCPPIPQLISPNNIIINNNDDDVDNKNNTIIFNNDNNGDIVVVDDVNNNKKVEEEKGLHEVEEVSKEVLLLKEDEEECSVEDGERLELSLGSPSFRVYCVHHHNSSDEEELEEIAEHLESEDCIKEDDKKCSRQESSSSNEVSEEKQILKKQTRMKKFKRLTIPKGGKRVLQYKMPSFYSFPCSCNSQNSHLMQQETKA